jgi:hypothetical protein
MGVSLGTALLLLAAAKAEAPLIIVSPHSFVLSYLRI